MLLNCFHLFSAIQGASPQDSWPHMAAGLQYVSSRRQPQVPLQETSLHRCSCAYCHQGCTWWGKTHCTLSLIAFLHVLVLLLIVFLLLFLCLLWLSIRYSGPFSLTLWGSVRRSMAQEKPFSSCCILASRCLVVVLLARQTCEQIIHIWQNVIKFS